MGPAVRIYAFWSTSSTVSIHATHYTQQQCSSLLYPVNHGARWLRACYCYELLLLLLLLCALRTQGRTPNGAWKNSVCSGGFRAMIYIHSSYPWVLYMICTYGMYESYVRTAMPYDVFHEVGYPLNSYQVRGITLIISYESYY